MQSPAFRIASSRSLRERFETRKSWRRESTAADVGQPRVSPAETVSVFLLKAAFESCTSAGKNLAIAASLYDIVRMANTRVIYDRIRELCSKAVTANNALRFSRNLWHSKLRVPVIAQSADIRILLTQILVAWHLELERHSAPRTRQNLVGSALLVIPFRIHFFVRKAARSVGALRLLP